MVIEPPEKMCQTGDLRANWKSFKQRFDLYVTAKGQKNKSDEQKVALQLTLAGSGDIDVYNTLDFGEPTAIVSEPGKVLSVVEEKFDDYLAPRRNEVYARYYCDAGHLKTKAKDCNYQGQRDKMIRDQVIFGINNEEVRMKLLKLEDPTLETVAKVCLVHETSANQLKAFKQDPSMTKQETDPLHEMKTTKPKQHA
ncbi:hypothetical protein HPB47_001555, partial [Ixodes persulcatus]